MRGWWSVNHVEADLKCVRTGDRHQEHDDTQLAKTSGTPIRADAAETLQEQVLALQQQLAAREAEVAGRPTYLCGGRPTYL